MMPDRTDAARRAAAEREKREAAALRANLHRRKAQARDKKEKGSGTPKGDGGAMANEGEG